MVKKRVTWLADVKFTDQQPQQPDMKHIKNMCSAVKKLLPETRPVLRPRKRHARSLSQYHVPSPCPYRHEWTSCWSGNILKTGRSTVRFKKRTRLWSVFSANKTVCLQSHSNSGVATFFEAPGGGGGRRTKWPHLTEITTLKVAITDWIYFCLHNLKSGKPRK